MARFGMEDLFREMEPPPGGLATLRTRLERQGRRRGGWVRWVGAGLAVLASVLIALWGPWFTAPTAPIEMAMVDHPAFIVATNSVAAEPVTVLQQYQRQTVVQRVTVSDRRVVLYLVDTLDGQ